MDLSGFCAGFGLVTNFSKCATYPVACSSLQLEGLLDVIPCEVKAFPCKYLGLPLHTRALRKVDVQPLIDRIAAKLPAWKAKFLDHFGRLTLVNSMLTSMPVHSLTVFALKKWAIRKIDSIRRSFLWKGAASANGGHCLVRRPKATRPKILGGLGILDLERFSRALRMRWFWQDWASPDRPSAGTAAPCDSSLFVC